MGKRFVDVFKNEYYKKLEHCPFYSDDQYQYIKAIVKEESGKKS